jgi:adenosylcobinamide kinase/adenosylcobinamide-phosphate guanylyltransferase
MNNRKILVTGGVKSGKSRYALQLGESFGGDKYFVATAQALDGEMERRIKIHITERPAHWETVEEPVEIGAVLNRHKSGVFIIDCLTLWTSNLLGKYDVTAFGEEARKLALAVAAFNGTVIVVTNEVGLGIIPGDGLSREYGDRLGMLNQEMAQVCDRVVLLVAGLPLEIKKGMKSEEDS